MPIHRQFTASCDVCDLPFTGTRFGHFNVVDGISEWSDHLKEAMRESAWTVGNKIVCPICQTMAVVHGISIKQLTTKEK